MNTSATALSRTGKAKYVAMLVAKAQPEKWQTTTLLLLFVEKGGVATGFVVISDAIESFTSCEVGRIYEFEVPGRYVKRSNTCKKYGVRNEYEVIVKCPCKVDLFSSAWPMLYPYDFADWQNFNQLQPRSFVDVIGVICEQPRFDANASIPKLAVQLR